LAFDFPHPLGISNDVPLRAGHRREHGYFLELKILFFNI